LNWGVLAVTSTADRLLQLLRLFVVIAAGWGATYAVATLGPVQESMREALHLTDKEIATLQGPILYLPSIFAAIPLGYLIDRYSRALLLAIFVALDAAAVMLAGTSRTFATLAVARAVIGLLMSAIAMDACALLGTMVSAAWRGRAFMVLSFAQVLGMSAAFYWGGAILVREGTWNATMEWLALPLALVCLLTVVLRDGSRDTPACERHGSPREVWTQIWAMRGRVLPLAFGPVGLSVGYMASLVWAPPILSRSLALRPDRVGAIMGTSLMISAISGPTLGGYLSDRIERLAGPRGLVTGLAILAALELPAGLFGITSNALMFEILLTLLSIMFFMKGILVSTLSIAAFPDELRGLCFGIQNAIMGIFASVSPLIVSQLAGRSMHAGNIGRALAVVCLTTSALGMVTFIWSRRHFLPRQLA